MHPLRKQIEQSITVLKEQMNEVAEEAKFVIDDYWAIFKVENKKIQLASSRGEDTKKPATLAPVLEDTNREGRKPAIRWRVFNSKMRRLGGNVEKAPAKSRGFSEPLRPTSRGYSGKQLSSNAGGWEANLAIQTELKLSDARKAIDHIQTAIVGLERILRYSKLHNQSQQEESND